MQSSVIKKLSILFLGLILLSVVSCKKDQDNIQETRVDIYLYTSDPQFINLNPVGGWVYITGGVRGIVVYRKSISEFMAYERSCTYQPDNANEYVRVDSSNIMLKDNNCGSKFLITDGTVMNGPAGLPLKQYQTTFDGNVLHIFN